MDEEKTLEELVQEHQESKWRYVLAVWDRLLPLIKWMAFHRENRIRGRFLNDADDYVQEAFLVLVRCMESFDCDRGPDFKSYYIEACKHRFCAIDRWDSREKRRKEVKTVSLYSPIHSADDSDDETLLIDTLFSKDDPFEDVTNTVALEEAIGTLPKNKRDVAWAYYVEEKSMEKIGKELGCSRQNVKYLLGEATRELGRRFAGAK